MRALLGISLAAVLLLAGCSGSSSDSSTSGSDTTGQGTGSGTSTGPATGTSGHSGSGTTTGSGSSSGTTGPGGNHAPAIDSFTPGVSAGTVPVAANFTFTAVDQDKDALSWTLSFGDGATDATGTGSSGAVPHTYGTVGNFTAKLTVSDGKAAANKTLVITVAAAASGARTTLTGAVKTNCASTCEGCDPTGMACNPVGGPGAGGCAGFAADQNGVDCYWWPLPATAANLPFEATSTGGDPDLEFWDTCDAVLGVGISNSWSVGPEAGSIPAGAGCLIAYEFNPVAPGGSTITFVYG